MSLPLPQSPYFPVKTKTNIEGISSYEARWYGESLERMNEPTLPELAADPNVEIYRFLILPTWGNSIAVRVQRQGKTFSLAARRLDGQAGYKIGKLIESQDIDLNEDDSAKLSTLIENLNFFQMPTDDHDLGKDGEQWILEGVARAKYHVVVRWSAAYDNRGKGELKAFVALCKFLIDKYTLSQRPTNKGEKVL
jgi:hypothetical protein